MNIQIFKKPIFIADKIVEKGSQVNGWQQRAVIGAVSLVCQPTIDLLNPFTDKETKKYSILKTVVKVIVGTSVGVLVRKNIQNLSTYLVDKRIMYIAEEYSNKISNKQFADNIAMLFGVIACSFTNFLLDMPLTQKGLNWGIKRFKLNKKEEN